MKEVAQKFVDRSAGLATDGFIVYDIQVAPDRQRPPLHVSHFSQEASRVWQIMPASSSSTCQALAS
jgi:hypothetical protein